MPTLALDAGTVAFLGLVLVNVAIAVFARRVRSRVRWRMPLSRPIGRRAAIPSSRQETS